jgi:hypothetical protein
MKFSHFIVFGGLVALMAVAGFSTGFIPVDTLAAAALVSVFFIASMVLLDSSDIQDILGLGSQVTGSTLKPSESWGFVNQRINQLEDEDFPHPYRKLNMDIGDSKNNRKIRQNTIDAKINGRETRVTFLVGRPETGQKYKEMIGFAVDLGIPDIIDYKGNLREREERENFLNGKKTFSVTEGEEIERSGREDNGPLVQIENDRRKGSEE